MTTGPWPASTSVHAPTPGPWIIVRQPGGRNPILIKSAALPMTAPAVFRLRDQKMHNLEANAQLAAASWELLDGARRARALLASVGNTEARAVVEALDAAIAKATGAGP
ncbi:hypothetical protein [Ramlibacter sp.]|uniref:hypothetical protein n=1 Tax=Ramlibacter sp. TaxID=1917967 RepID=UPI0026173447|nr:hypothetical protein [Ramlibacter sp.]MDB5957507.1 hypothetical protein [Ramlibacter sp.]